MRAVCVKAFASYATARIEEMQEPVAGPDDVEISVQAAEANYSDILVMPGAYQIKPPLPFSPSIASES